MGSKRVFYIVGPSGGKNGETTPLSCFSDCLTMVVRFTLERVALGKASCHLRTELGTEVLEVLGPFK